MEALIISRGEAKLKRYAMVVISLYFLAFFGYLMFDKAATDQYHLLFFFSLLGVFLALILFLSNTLWVSSKPLFIIDKQIIESTIKGNKLKLEWVKVSKVAIAESEIIFYIDGGRKEKKLNLACLTYGDVAPVKEKVAELCGFKNIVCQSQV